MDTVTKKIYGNIKEILVERFAIDAARIHLGSDLQKDLELDSIDAIDLLLALNEKFSIRISEDSLEKVHLISDLVAVIEKHKPRV